MPEIGTNTQSPRSPTRAPRDQDGSSLPELLTVDVLAAKWSLKPGTIRAWARQGRIPSRKMGRLIVFDTVELSKWYEHLPTTVETNG